MTNFFTWYNSEASQDDKALADKVFSFEPLFDDMLFRPGSITYEYTSCTINGTENSIHYDLPEKIEHFDMESYRFKVTDLEPGVNGCYDQENKTVCIIPGHLKNDSTVLHEMIHLFELLINDLPIYFHDVLCIALYKDLSSKITDLDRMIAEHANILNQYDLGNVGGIHDILFYLKSLSLDISMNYPLNTIMGYGYQKGGDADDLT